MTTNLPPLPEPIWGYSTNTPKFSADQMHAYARAAMAQASAEPCYTEQQIADACMEAEISDGHCESLLIALGDSAPTAQPAPSADVPEADFGKMAQAGAEPVAPMSQPNRLIAYTAAAKLREIGYEWDGHAWTKCTPLPAREPLTFAQVCDLMPPDFGWNAPCTPGLVRHIIEAAHGITATPADKEQA